MWLIFHEILFRFFEKDQLRVKCGNIKLKAKGDRGVKSIIYHPLYDEPKLTNNIGIIFLEEDYDLVENEINVACLPTSSSSTEFDPSTCIGTGWGAQFEGIKKLKILLDKPCWSTSLENYIWFSAINDRQVTLKSIFQPILDRPTCKEKLDLKGNLAKSKLCAGGQGQNFCSGDGGGPLVCNLKDDPSRFVQAGIISGNLAGSDCSENGQPGIFESVTNGLCFIKHAIGCKVHNFNSRL